MTRRTTDLAQVSADILAEVENAERVKQAEVSAVHAATPRFKSELGQLMHKVAEELRNDTNEVTYDDLRAFQEGRL